MSIATEDIQVTRIEKIKLIEANGYTFRALDITVSGKTGQYIIEGTEETGGLFLYSRDGGDREINIVVSIINSQKVA